MATSSLLEFPYAAKNNDRRSIEQHQHVVLHCYVNEISLTNVMCSLQQSVTSSIKISIGDKAVTRLWLKTIGRMLVNGPFCVLSFCRGMRIPSPRSKGCLPLPAWLKMSRTGEQTTDQLSTSKVHLLLHLCNYYECC